MYTLYLSYDLPVSYLFLTGFLSGAICAPFLGGLVDKIGRKKSCLIYCALEIVINTLEHYNSLPLLLFGRVLGGITTNLLFTAFDAWLVKQNALNFYPKEKLQQTYGLMSVFNGFSAILAGVVSQVLEDYGGLTGPFTGAVGLTILTFVLIAFWWGENYGDGIDDDETAASSSSSSSSSSTSKEVEVSFFTQFKTQLSQGWRTTSTDKKILLCGLTQSLSEAATYTFVFLWVPTLLEVSPVPTDKSISLLPTGAVFSCFMICITIGGLLFPLITRLFNHKLELVATVTFFLSSAAMCVTAVCMSPNFDTPFLGVNHLLPDANDCFLPTIITFLLLETTIGLSTPLASTLRSKYVPVELQGCINNFFRLPLNLGVVLGTLSTDYYGKHICFFIISGLFAASGLVQGWLWVISWDEKKIEEVKSSSPAPPAVITANVTPTKKRVKKVVDEEEKKDEKKIDSPRREGLRARKTRVEE